MRVRRAKCKLLKNGNKIEGQPQAVILTNENLIPSPNSNPISDPNWNSDPNCYLNPNTSPNPDPNHISSASVEVEEV
jgi:hypothetical protein